MENELSIIIVNFNGGDLVISCISSIYENPPDRSFEIIFIDNASTDTSGDKVSAQFPEVRFVQNSENEGLSKAFNKGLKMAQGRLLLSLDNDTKVLPEALSALMDHLASDPAIGAVGARLYNPDMSIQKTARRAPSAVNSIFGRRSFVTRLFPGNKISKRYLMEEQLHNTAPYKVDWVSTAALMVKKEVVEKAGGLDEDFFVYWVDADWCASIRNHGWQIHAVPAACIIHDENLKGRRRTRCNKRMVIDFHRGAFRYYFKNHCRTIWHPMVAIAFLGLSLRAARIILWDYLRHLPEALNKYRGA